MSSISDYDRVYFPYSIFIFKINLYDRQIFVRSRMRIISSFVFQLGGVYARNLIVYLIFRLVCCFEIVLYCSF